MHLKRKTIPSFWPISRTGTKYLAVATHEQTNSIPLIIVIRDLLKLVKNKKEMKKILSEKKILVNGKAVQETGYPLMLFDSLSIPQMKKNYKVTLNGKKLDFVEVNEKEALSKMHRVMGKKVLSGKKIQLNLSAGKNILSNEKASIGDFLLVNCLDNKILKKIKLEKGTEVLVVKGKHTGETGKIREIFQEGENMVATVAGKKEIKVNVNTLFALN